MSANKLPMKNKPRTRDEAERDRIQDYWQRQTPARQQREQRRQQHQFADDIGGNSSNYRFG